MKTPIYVIVLLALLMFSCSKEELNNDILTVVTTNFSDNQTRSKATNSRTSEDVCFVEQLINSNQRRVGWVFFRVLEEEIMITYKTNVEYKIHEININFEDSSSEGTVPSNLADPIISQFMYSSSNLGGINTITYMINKADINAVSVYAAHAFATGPRGKMQDIWAESWATYNIADFSDCGSWPEEGDFETCVYTKDTEFYIPLMSDSSGSYPDAGMNSDIVVLTPEEPFTSGNLNIDIVFNEIPKEFGNATLSINFIDLDLSPDTISINGNVVIFEESFTLRNQNNEILAVLDETHSEDGNFIWNFDIPNDIFDNTNKLILHATLDATLSLSEGEGIQISNTIEGMYDISLCGEVLTSVQ